MKLYESTRDKNFMSISKRPGFTLIELLVVIAIIALLMSIMMPALGKVKEQANLILCKSRLRQWTLVFKLYTDDNGGLFPEECSIDQGYVSLTQSYLKDERLRLCPTATKTPPEGGQQPFAAWEEDGFKGSYGLNDWVLSGWEGISDEQDGWLWKTPNVKGATQVPVILDCSIFTYVNPRHENEPPAYVVDVIYGSGSASGELKRFCVNRHQEMTNGAFLDFSVRRVGLKELWELRWHRNWPMDADPPDWPAWMEHMKDYAE
jgi:prepilin-type N-terminal cleavage/methylation domain-containing protein